MLVRLPTPPTSPKPPPPENQTGAQIVDPADCEASNVCLIRPSISSFSPSATAQTVSSSGVVIHGNRVAVFATAWSIVSAWAISYRSVFR